MKKLNVIVAWECISRIESKCIEVPEDVYTALKYGEGEVHEKAWIQLISVLEECLTDVVMLENGAEITYRWFVLDLKL